MPELSDLVLITEDDVAAVCVALGSAAPFTEGHVEQVAAWISETRVSHTLVELVLAGKVGVQVDAQGELVFSPRHLPAEVRCPHCGSDITAFALTLALRPGEWDHRKCPACRDWLTLWRTEDGTPDVEAGLTEPCVETG